MPSSPEPTEQILSDVTQRLQALNRSQTSLFSVHSSISLPVRHEKFSREYSECRSLSGKYSPNSQLQVEPQINKMEIALRPRGAVEMAPKCPALPTEQYNRGHRNSEAAASGRSSKGRLKSFFNESRRKLKRSKPEPVPKARVSAYFAGRKTSQRSASSGDSGYESMERPDPVESLLGWKTRQSQEYQEPVVLISKSSLQTDKGGLGGDHAYFNRRRNDQINKFKRFSRQLEKKPLLRQAEAAGEAARAQELITGVTPKPLPGRLASMDVLPDSVAETAGIAILSSAMSSTDDVLGELVSPVTYRSRLESCRQSGSSLSDGELSFMGGRSSKAPSVYSINIFDSEGDTLSQRFIRSRTTSRTGSNQSSPPTSARHTPATSVSSAFKRGRSKDEGCEDPDEEDVRRQDSNTKRLRTEAQPDLKLFACPYAKYDPRRYSELNLIEKEYRRCSCSYLRDIPRLKQHLYRVHRRPEYYCGSCFESFRSREMLDVHVRQRPSCEVRSPRFEEKMTDEQLNSIKRRIVKGDPCELWFNIFKTLFPDAPKPLSPYASNNDPTSVNHFVSLFRWFGPEEMGSLLRARREQGDRRLLLEGPTQAIVDEAFEIALPRYLQAQQEGRSSSSVGSDLSLVPPTPSGHIDPNSSFPLGFDVQHVASMDFSEQDHASYAAMISEHHIPAAFTGQNESFLVPQPGQAQTYPTSGWIEPAFDHNDVVQAFDAYGAAAKMPLQNISELDADVFFDFPGYKT